MAGNSSGTLHIWLAGACCLGPDRAGTQARKQEPAAPDLLALYECEWVHDNDQVVIQKEPGRRDLILQNL